LEAEAELPSMMQGIPDQLDRGYYRAHFYDEHHRVFRHRSRLEFAERINNGSQQDGAIRERLFPDLCNFRG
jgi:hypothetical protein